MRHNKIEVHSAQSFSLVSIALSTGCVMVHRLTTPPNAAA
jgi:hypothetical protein